MKMQGFGAALMAAAVLVGSESGTTAQDKPAPPSAQQLFEAGQYDEAMKSIGEMREKGSAGLPDAFLAAQIALKQTQNDRAKEEFAKLSASDDPVWKLVGESGTAAIENDRDKAVEFAGKAVDTSKS